MGPSMVPMAIDMLAIETYLPYFSGGAASVMRIAVRVKHPPPPSPWKARKMILHLTLALFLRNQLDSLYPQLCHGLSGRTASTEDSEQKYHKYGKGFTSEDVAQLSRENNEGCNGFFGYNQITLGMMLTIVHLLTNPSW